MEQATCSTQDCSESPAARGLCGKCYGKAWRRGCLPDHPTTKPRHVVTDVDPEARTGTCTLCGPVKVTYKSNRNYFQCQTVTAKNRTIWKSPPESIRKWDLKRKYGLAFEQYEEMYQAASGACEICRTPLPVLHVDHDHDTGEVRGLLCRPCNQGIGHFRDDVDLLASAGLYLSRSHSNLEASA